MATPNSEVGSDNSSAAVSLERHPSHTAATSWMSLYRDVLHSIFHFLTLPELILTGRTNTRWLEASSSSNLAKNSLTPTNGYEYGIDVTKLESLLRSRSRRQIRHLYLSGMNVNDEISHQRLRDSMDHLQSLDISYAVEREDFILDHQPKFTYPQHLTDLKISCFVDFRVPNGSPLQAALGQSSIAMLAAIAHDSKQLTTLELDIHSDATASLIHIDTIPTLTDLTTRYLNLEGFGRLKKMKQLRSIELTGITWDLSQEFRANHLNRLLDENGHSSLESIKPLCVLQLPYAQVLAQFTSLTRLSSHFMFSDPSILLSHLPKLTDLTCWCTDKVDLEQLCFSLGALTGLTSLYLGHPALTDAHLKRILAPLKLLTELGVGKSAKVVTLTCLSEIDHLSTHLQILKLYDLSLPPTELIHLRCLTQLRVLSIYRCCESAGGLDEPTRASMTPGSSEFLQHCWPYLIDFNSS